MSNLRRLRQMLGRSATAEPTGGAVVFRFRRAERPVASNERPRYWYVAVASQRLKGKSERETCLHAQPATAFTVKLFGKSKDTDTPVETQSQLTMIYQSLLKQCPGVGHGKSL